MSTVTVTTSVDVDVDVDEVLSEMDDDEIAAALRRRRYSPSGTISPDAKLTLIYEEFRRRNLEAPQVLKDYIYDVIGRIL